MPIEIKDIKDLDFGDIADALMSEIEANNNVAMSALLEYKITETNYTQRWHFELVVPDDLVDISIVLYGLFKLSHVVEVVSLELKPYAIEFGSYE